MVPSDHASLSDLMAPADSISWEKETPLLVQMGLLLSRTAKNWVVLVSLPTQLLRVPPPPSQLPSLTSNRPSHPLLPC